MMNTIQLVMQWMTGAWLVYACIPAPMQPPFRQAACAPHGACRGTYAAPQSRFVSLVPRRTARTATCHQACPVPLTVPQAVQALVWPGCAACARVVRPWRARLRRARLVLEGAAQSRQPHGRVLAAHRAPTLDQSAALVRECERTRWLAIAVRSRSKSPV